MSEFAPRNPRINDTFLQNVPRRVVSENERKVLDLVRRGEPISRADLTRATGLTAQSVSRIVETLVERRFLKMGKAIASGRGQPSTPISLNPSAAFAIGISIMTDAIAGAMMNFSGEIIGQTQIELTSCDLETILKNVETVSENLIADTGINSERVFGMGVGVTGYFVNDKRKVNPPEPLDALAFIDIDEIISERMGLPVWLDNDGHVAAMGESLAGVGRENRNFAYIFFSKGLGGSLVIDSRIYRGAFGNSGEFVGVMYGIEYSEVPTLEKLRLCVNQHGQNLKDIHELIERFDMDWPGVEEWIEQATPHLKSIVVAITAVFDPEVIVLGGRIPVELASKLGAGIKLEFTPRRGFSVPFPPILASAVTGDATAIGAASAPFKAHFFI